jgi:hypothetical protein
MTLEERVKQVFGEMQFQMIALATELEKQNQKVVELTKQLAATEVENVTPISGDGAAPRKAKLFPT